MLSQEAPVDQVNAQTHEEVSFVFPSKMLTASRTDLMWHPDCCFGVV